VVKDSELTQPRFKYMGGVMSSTMDEGFASLAKRDTKMEGNSWRSITRLDVSNSTFTRHVNDKGHGGGVVFTSAENSGGYPIVAHFTDCSFKEGSSALTGGVFAVKNGGLMTFRNSTFEGNTASGNGGAGYVEGGVVMMEDCAARYSFSDVSGGFIYAVGTSLSTSLNPIVHVHLQNVILRSGSALGGGGALGVDSGARATLHGCLLLGHSVRQGGRGGAVMVGAGSNLVAVNTVFEQNSAPGGLGGGVEASSAGFQSPLFRTSTGRGVIENKQSTDVESPPNARGCKSSSAEGASCSDLGSSACSQ